MYTTNHEIDEICLLEDLISYNEALSKPAPNKWMFVRDELDTIAASQVWELVDCLLIASS